MIKQRPSRSSATPPTGTSATVAAPVPTATTPVPAAPDTNPGPSTDRPKAAVKTGPKTSSGEASGVQLAERIGQKLKSMFDDLVAEPVPEKFRQLLEELERKSGKS